MSLVIQVIWHSYNWVFVSSLGSYLCDSWGICRLRCDWRLFLDVTSASDLRLDTADSLQGLLPSFFSLLHASKSLQNGLHLSFFSCLQM